MNKVIAIKEGREVMDIREAAEYLGLSPDTLYKYASEGFIPAFKFGNRWRFKRSQVDARMEELCQSQQRERSSAAPER